MKKIKKSLSILAVIMLAATYFAPAELNASDDWPRCRTNNDEVCASGSTSLPEGGSIEWEVAGEQLPNCNNPGGCINE